ncbi:MAG: hypothetical protein P8H62_13170 [Henriciella sp.]|nr:hypothetical protein [Henriciella sp.]
MSNAVDRHLRQLLDEGRLVKAAPGLYMVPRKTRFGDAPADATKLVAGFLKDDRFLMVSPNDYNGLGVGTTQLYNEMVVYNGKRHGQFELGGRPFDFRRKPFFPSEVSAEFLLVDLLNNVTRLAEDQEAVMARARNRAREMDPSALKSAVEKFGGVRAKRELMPVLDNVDALARAA